MIKLSIQTKLLALCILLVFLTTVSISAAYYTLTRQDKHRESRQRIRIAFDIILMISGPNDKAISKVLMNF